MTEPSSSAAVGQQKPTALTPIDRLMATAGVIAAKMIVALPLVPELRDRLTGEAQDVRRATPSLAETLLADAALALAEAYPNRFEALEAFRAARELVAVLRARPRPDEAEYQTWEQRAGLVG